jgi:hypothetical protein
MFFAIFDYMTPEYLQMEITVTEAQEEVFKKSVLPFVEKDEFGDVIRKSDVWEPVIQQDLVNSGAIEEAPEKYY